MIHCLSRLFICCSAPHAGHGIFFWVGIRGPLKTRSQKTISLLHSEHRKTSDHTRYSILPPDGPCGFSAFLLVDDWTVPRGHPICAVVNSSAFSCSTSVIR